MGPQYSLPLIVGSLGGDKLNLVQSADPSYRSYFVLCANTYRRMWDYANGLALGKHLERDERWSLRARMHCLPLCDKLSRAVRMGET